MSEQAAAKQGFLAGLTGLQKLTLALAAVLSIAGAGLWGFGVATAPDRPAATASGEDGLSGLEPQGFTDESTSGTPEAREGADDPSEKTALEMYSPTVFRLGFAFFLGFSIAYALRAALKVVIIVTGVVLLLLITLQMGGLITVNWEAMDGVYQSAGTWLGEQTESLSAFVRGYIPSGGTALAGFGVGFLKKH